MMRMTPEKYFDEFVAVKPRQEHAPTPPQTPIKYIKYPIIIKQTNVLMIAVIGLILVAVILALKK